MVRKDGSQEPSVASVRARVLVIDHDPATRRVLAKALASVSPLPLEIIEVERAEDGVAAARQASFGAAIVSR